MSIFRKSHLEEPLQALDRYYRELREALSGAEPTANIAHLHGFEDREAFAAEHTDVSLDRLIKAIAHFKVEVESLKGIKTIAIKPPR